MSRKLLTIEDVRALLESEVEAAGGQRAWALRAGMSATFVGKVLRGTDPPSERICEALGIREDGRRWVRV